MRGLGLVVIALIGCTQDQQDRAYGETLLDHQVELDIPPLKAGQTVIGRFLDSCPEGGHPGCDTQLYTVTQVTAGDPLVAGAILPDGAFQLGASNGGTGRVSVQATSSENGSRHSAYKDVFAEPWDMPPDGPTMANPDKCMMAPIIIPGMYQGDSTSYLDDATPPGACTNGFSAFGPDAFYRVDLTAGQVLTATVMPSGWDAMLYVLKDCSVNACYAGVDAGGASATETTTFTATADGTYHVVVDSPSQTNKGLFTLDVVLQ